MSHREISFEILLSWFAEAARDQQIFNSSQEGKWPGKSDDIQAAGSEVEVEFCSFATEMLPPASGICTSETVSRAKIDHEDEQPGSPHNLLVILQQGVDFFHSITNCSANIFSMEELSSEYV